MTPGQWERALVAYYLLQDGPCGSGPLTYLAATPAELSEAVRGELDEDAAKAAFLGQFGIDEVRRWLGGGASQAAGPEKDVPGYFKYLVLTCYVASADAEDAGDSHDFRVRLGEMLGYGAAFQSVAAVNALWERLAGWCDRRRARGEPIRRIVLPDPGPMVLIGRAVRLAFPTWRDRGAFRGVLRRVPLQVRADPERLIFELARPHHQLAGGVREAFLDFRARYDRGERMLRRHRFWSLVESVSRELAAEGRGRIERWRLDVSFGGFEGDLAYMQLFTGDVGDDALPRFEGGLVDLVARPDLPRELRAALDGGLLLLKEPRGGCWSWGGETPSLDDGVVLLARKDGVAARWPLPVHWRALDGGWLASDRVQAWALRGLLARLDRPPPAGAAILDLELRDGVRTGRGTLLGRPEALPWVDAPPGATVSARPLGEVRGALVVEGAGPSWRMCSTEPVHGRWALEAREGGSETEVGVVFEADAPERRDWSAPETARWEREPELVEAGQGLGPEASESTRDAPLGKSDLAEAIYAGAPASGWAEAELVPLICRWVGRPARAWDVLRSFAEASWLDPWLARGWRVRRWALRPPRLVALGPERVRVEGALGAAAHRRLEREVSSRGGEVRTGGSICALVPGAPVVDRVDPSGLSEALGWSLVDNLRPQVAAAPACWAPEPRTREGRSLTAVWDFDAGAFRTDSRVHSEDESVLLERWVRERGDDRDVYRVVSAASERCFSSRQAALLEACRLANRPLFKHQDGSLRRRARGGYLPLTIGRALARRSGTTPGPLDADGAEYVYPVEVGDARWVSAMFGAAVEVQTGAASAARWIDALALARHGRGRSLTLAGARP